MAHHAWLVAAFDAVNVVRGDPSGIPRGADDVARALATADEAFDEGRLLGLRRGAQLLADAMGAPAGPARRDLLRLAGDEFARLAAARPAGGPREGSKETRRAQLVVAGHWGRFHLHALAGEAIPAVSQVYLCAVQHPAPAARVFPPGFFEASAGEAAAEGLPRSARIQPGALGVFRARTADAERLGVWRYPSEADLLRAAAEDPGAFAGAPGAKSQAAARELLLRVKGLSAYLRDEAPVVVDKVREVSRIRLASPDLLARAGTEREASAGPGR